MSDSDFDSDDDLRALLRSGDPAGSLSPADPAGLAILLEDIMSADLDVRPAAKGAGPPAPTVATGSPGWSPLRPSPRSPPEAPSPSMVFPVTDTNAPTAGDKPTVTGPDVAGQTTELGVAAKEGRCAVPTPAILAQYPVAFQGTVTSIEGDTVTLDTTEVLQGEVGETVQVTAPQGLFDAMIGTVDFQVGGDYLVAAFDGQMSQCYSGSAGGALRSPFDKAFVH